VWRINRIPSIFNITFINMEHPRTGELKASVLLRFLMPSGLQRHLRTYRHTYIIVIVITSGFVFLLIR